ncbi:MAG TPA: undecaprenyl-diphosphate phosphatase [Prolixibacteraceae bacterium]|nr:undecaprenyl-diphosphate phosphatase [Prolixibacteraceae bacterium]
MSVIEAFILGLIQGLTEFLPVSSSGHLELGHALFGIKSQSNLKFELVLHAATVLSTLIVFRKDIIELITGLFKFKWDDNNKYIAMLLLSAIPAGIAGVLYEDKIEAMFTGNLLLLGIQFLFTALLLAIAFFKPSGNRKINFLDAFILGIAQMVAIIPAISRSGATIATGLIIGNERSGLAKFSFLMVIIPIVGALFMKAVSGDMINESTVATIPMLVGFLAAFISGLLACKWMINLVKKGKLIYFAIYCLVIGLFAIFAGCF